MPHVFTIEALEGTPQRSEITLLVAEQTLLSFSGVFRCNDQAENILPSFAK